MKLKTISYLALGDSYTIGEAVELKDNFPFQLAESLKHEQIEVEPTIVAKTGFTTDELLEAINEANIKTTYDMVSLLIGVNNQYRARSVDEFKTQLMVLIDKSLSFVNNNVNQLFMLSIPDYGFTPFGLEKQVKISEQLNIFNEISKNIADSKGIKYFYITNISRRGIEEPNLIASDGLHPSAKMYQEWVNLMKPDLIKIIQNID
jgi:lysophospholipase L1-like esterase